jgi:hypothetical protein
MKEIIPPVDRALLEKELTEDLFVRKSNNGNTLIYIFTHDQAPNLMLEVGRLREISFRGASGGTGKSTDIDAFDIAPIPFKQLIVWDPSEKEIVGGYRFIIGKEVEKDDKGYPKTPTAKIFQFSKKFVDEYWPVTFELGRSFVQPLYQPTVNMRKGMYSLDNLWDGLGAISIDHPEIKYFFGKITMYPKFNKLARDLILHFMQKYFKDSDKLVHPIIPLQLTTSADKLESYFTGSNYEENYKILSQQVRNLNENIPPLVNAYMNLSETMRVFGTSINKGFGDVEETAILITIADMYDHKVERHLATYKKAE